MSSIRDVLKEAIHQYLVGDEPVAVDQIIAHARESHPDVFVQYAEMLTLKGARAMVKHLLREATNPENPADEPGQLILPGMKMPFAIAFEEGGEYKYIAAQSARWAHLQKALHERELNIDRAIAQRADWERKLDYLRPGYCQVKWNSRVLEAKSVIGRT